MGTIFDIPSTRSSFKIPSYGIADADPIPDELLNSGIDLPELSELEVVRHYTDLSMMNIGVDSAMYPLGSCTMKYNPKINERAAAMGGFASLHPLCGDESSQGALKLLHELGLYLSEITGMSRFSCAPAAGAHGELAGVMMIKKYFEHRKETRRFILIPDSAHGTNPASVAMCGFEVKEVPSTKEGDVDLEALASCLDENVAAMMLTSPSTLGLFDRGILRIAEMLHAKGALFYCDGANLNAVLGRASIAAMGFDLMHINLHKTFSTPHGGGGPGAGPIGSVEKLAPFLPGPFVSENDGTYGLDNGDDRSIGRLHSFYGNFLVCVKAYAYIRSLGAAGLKEVSENAVLNANYLLSKLKQYYDLPYQRLCKHEFVLSDAGFPNGVTANDIAKRILDAGYHAPTVYFPLLVHGAIMIEPTETESLATLDRFADAMISIRGEAETEPELVKSAPHTTPVRRVDAVLAARKPVIKG
mgnify:CR=1 FL=1